MKNQKPIQPGAWLKTFSSDRGGAVAVLVGFVMVGVIAMAAVAMDVTSAISAHARLRQAADTAAMAAVRQAAIDTAADAKASLAGARTAGLERFMAQASNIPRVTGTPPVVDVVHDGLVITATVTFSNSYATQLTNTLSGMSPSFGTMATIPLGGVAAARQTLGAYTDLQVLMDISGSMTIATPDQTARLESIMHDYPFWYGRDNAAGWSTGNTCQFACHSVFPWSGSRIAARDNYDTKPPGADMGPYDPQTYDYYDMTRRLNITLRIDLIKGAVSQIVAAIKQDQSGAKLRISLDTFDDTDSEQNVVSIRHAENVGTLVDNTGPALFNKWQYNSSNTDIADSLAAFTRSIVPAGQGLSQSDPRKVVVIITDGVEDHATNSGRQTTLFNHKGCDLLKAPVDKGGKGAVVYVLHAASSDNFVSESSGVTFDGTVAEMTLCASSPANYFLASSKADITSATAKIIASALSQATILTQATPPASSPPPNRDTDP